MVTNAMSDLASELKLQQVVIFMGGRYLCRHFFLFAELVDTQRMDFQSFISSSQSRIRAQLHYSHIPLEYRNAPLRYAPDYRAQFMEKCAGSRYFEMLTSLDIPIPTADITRLPR